MPFTITYRYKGETQVRTAEASSAGAAVAMPMAIALYGPWAPMACRSPGNVRSTQNRQRLCGESFAIIRPDFRRSGLH